MNFIKRLVLAISIMPIFAHSAIEGVTLGSTRVIYKSTDEMSVVKATNFSEKITGCCGHGCQIILMIKK